MPKLRLNINKNLAHENFPGNTDSPTSSFYLGKSS